MLTRGRTSYRHWVDRVSYRHWVDRVSGPTTRLTLPIAPPSIDPVRTFFYDLKGNPARERQESAPQGPEAAGEQLLPARRDGDCPHAQDSRRQSPPSRRRGSRSRRGSPSLGEHPYFRESATEALQRTQEPRRQRAHSVPSFRGTQRRTAVATPTNARKYGPARPANPSSSLHTREVAGRDPPRPLLGEPRSSLPVPSERPGSGSRRPSRKRS